jgi:beta-lactamase regulating signal transducer with metallopeptidase domain
VWWLSCILSNVVIASSLALAAWFVQKRLRRHAFARVLWLLVLIKLITPSLLSVPVSTSPGKFACMLGMCRCGRHATAQMIVHDWLPWTLLAAWAAGAGATAWTAWRRWNRLQRLIADANPAPLTWQSQLEQLASELAIRRPPQILAVPGRLPPLVVASWRHPRMLLPTDLMRRLNRVQRAALLLHELIHIKRGDHLTRMLQLIVGVAYWWLPVVGRIGRQLSACEEVCCDAEVVDHLPNARVQYARLLLDVVDFTSASPREIISQVTAMSAADDLEQRLRAILESQQITRPAWSIKAFAAVVACALLPCGLHCELIARPARATTSAELPRAAETSSRVAHGASADALAELVGCAS